MFHKKFILSLLLNIFCVINCSIEAKQRTVYKEKADYVIVGVGTAGATLAKLLTDDLSTSVIALHNGKNLSNDPDIKCTKNVLFTVVSALFDSPFYKTGNTVRQPNANNRELFWAMGIPAGGDSAINAGAWSRGTNQVYSQWEALAGPEWSSAIIEDIYVNLEQYVGTTQNPTVRGFKGPLEIRQNPVKTTVAAKFAQAITLGTGIPAVDDYNDPFTPIGVSEQMQYTQKGSQGQFRESSAVAFLNKNIVTRGGEGVDGRKLNIKYNSTALRTIWKDNKAIGVVYSKDGITRKVYAKKGVIVTAGLYSSMFLLNSGIGPQADLEDLGIKVKYNNPNVGRGLADQVLSIVVFATNPEDTSIIQNNCHPTNGGISVEDVITLLNLQIPNDQKQKLAETLLFPGHSFPGNSIFGTTANFPAPGGDPTIRQVRLTTVNPVPGIAACLFDLVQPQSRGVITLNKLNRFQNPIIDSGIFSNPADLELFVQAYQVYLKNINNAFQLIDPQYELIFPPAELLDDSNLVREFIKEIAVSNQCFQGHCRMAPLSQGGVVNGRGKVYGVENLYVADDSIVPVAMDGTPMASAYLIAVNMARLIK